MEWIIDFFKSNPFSHLLLSYAIEKGFDTVGEIPKKIYNNAKQNFRRSRANFEQRNYTNYDFTKLYANADMLV